MQSQNNGLLLSDSISLISLKEKMNVGTSMHVVVGLCVSSVIGGCVLIVHLF